MGIISRPESPNRTVSSKALTVSCGPLGDEITCWVTDECLNETLFGTLRNARKTLDEWQEDYNWRRPHSALANMTPMEFLQRKAMDS
ncbi:hypothetical protein EOK75_20390 (plasmid) [Pseudorhodobacter turbinis]|uniref:Integrase catalytic domain-containing protein n=1 Tax=Pseudorhodobacter turbinis TaxID=2500533 RepID=A0A4V1E1H4_9RHOB|nr:hypothetical protein EOK75_20390 [Pseudorhodobacter turbinis]